MLLKVVESSHISQSCQEGHWLLPSKTEFNSGAAFKGLVSGLPWVLNIVKYLEQRSLDQMVSS